MASKSRPGLYAMVFLGLFATANIGNTVKQNWEINNQNRVILETLAQKSTPQTANVLGDSIPEQFYVINGDTVYQKIDGMPTRQYFENRRSARPQVERREQ